MTARPPCCSRSGALRAWRLQQPKNCNSCDSQSTSIAASAPPHFEPPAAQSGTAAPPAHSLPRHTPWDGCASLPSSSSSSLPLPSSHSPSTSSAGRESECYLLLELQANGRACCAAALLHTPPQQTAGARGAQIPALWPSLSPCVVASMYASVSSCTSFTRSGTTLHCSAAPRARARVRMPPSVSSRRPLTCGRGTAQGLGHTKEAHQEHRRSGASTQAMATSALFGINNW